MIKLDNLVGQLCPNGVKFLSLGELLDHKQPSRFLVKSVEYDDSFSTPVLTAGQTFVLGYTDEEDGIYHASATEPVVIFDDFTTSFKWVDFSFKAKSSAMKILVPKENVNLRYVWFAMQTIPYVPQDHARQWIGVYSKFRIPVPPLPVQQEIVRILDMFTQLEAELEAELEARREQYDYYRNALFTGDDISCEWQELGMHGAFQRGSALQKKHLTDKGKPCIHYGEVYTYYGITAYETKSFVTEEFSVGKRVLHPGDLFIATTSENEEDLGKAVAWLGKAPAVASSDALIYRTDLEPRYVSHYFSSIHFNKQKLRFITGTKVKRLSDRALAQIAIPVPTLEKQREIADILDKFDTIVNDLSSGLPAEIEARRKQYEYYRDKLLSFKELSS